ncbi:hypothetical protein N431DRAFT_467181 [Stipitochalara longipes BDJ]|nr:hypothetical protein N431DRAFT_467181 [Stipitochalara longipes BDJ]
MSTSQSGQPDGTPYPSYKELRNNRVPINSTDAVKRLFWRFDDVFPAAISVMKTPSSPYSLEPYFQAESGAWHEISQFPLTENKVSSIEVSVWELEQWRRCWLEQHGGHSNGEYVTYGDLSDDERPYPSEMNEEGGWDSDSDTPYLVRCCGEDRPRNETAKIVVTPSQGNHFVTVQDYVSAVHPWLMSLREDILQARKVGAWYPRSMPTEFIVMSTVPDDIRLDEKQHWIEGIRPEGRPVSAHAAAIIARLGLNRPR